MDVSELLEDARAILRMLYEKGYTGDFVVQGQFGVAPLDNIEYNLRQWASLVPEDTEMGLSLSVNMDWTRISFVQYSIGLSCRTNGHFYGSRMEVRKIGRMSNMELGRIELEFEMLVKIPSRYQARTALERNGRLDNN